MKREIKRSYDARPGWARGLALVFGGLFFAAALFAAAYLMAQTGPYRPPQPAPGKITDMHCHAAGIGAGGSGCFVSPRLRDSVKFAIYLRAFGVNCKELAEKGDMLIPDRIAELAGQSRSVDKVVLLAMDGVVGPDGELDKERTEVYVPDEFIAAAAARHANLLFGASVNPYRKDALPRLKWAKSHGAVLVKWIPSIMEIDPADPRLKPFYLELVRLNLPLVTHTGFERSFSKARDELADPEKLALPLSLGVKVIASHIASTGEYNGERSTDRLARMMAAYPGLYSDISSLTQSNKRGYLKEALTRPEFAGRLLYGSDFPLINTPLVSPWYHLRQLSPRAFAGVLLTKNPWDRDVLLKQELGVPAEVFSLPGRMIGGKQAILEAGPRPPGKPGVFHSPGLFRVGPERKTVR